STSSCSCLFCSSRTSRLMYVFLWRTSTLTVRARPCVLACLSSLCVLRASVILRGADTPTWLLLVGSLAPCARRRCVSGSSFASSLMSACGPATWMPADSSCTSSRSTGTFRTSANCATVTSDIGLPEFSGATGFEPDLARLHDELAGLFGRQPFDIQQIVDR